LVVKDGEHQTLDVEKVVAEARIEGKKLIARAGI
jgi:hypothetical protein